MKCRICGKELPAGRQRYCSRSCFDKAKILETTLGEDFDDELILEQPSASPAPKRRSVKSNHLLFTTSDQEKLSNLAFTAAGIVTVSALALFYFISTVHDGPYFLQEPLITIAHVVYALVLAAAGFGLRTKNQVWIRIFLISAGIFLGIDIIYLLSRKAVLAVVPALVNVYILYSSWMLHVKAYDQ